MKICLHADALTQNMIWLLIHLDGDFGEPVAKPAAAVSLLFLAWEEEP
jgi:hypothetical protein